MPIMDTLCVELTSRCPLRCVHCSANATPFGQSYMPVQQLLDFLTCLPQLRELYLSGGEPFEHPEILPLIRALQHYGSTVLAYSSGTTISDLKLRSLSYDVLVAARQSGLRRLDISLYAPTPDLHDAITGTPGSFSATIETAKRASHAALPLGIHFVPIGPAADTIIETYSLACRLEATHFHVLALAPQGRARSAISDLAPPTTFWSRVEKVSRNAAVVPALLSRQLRRRLGHPILTARDTYNAAFLDVKGYLYPGEGCRLPALRSRTSVFEGTSKDKLIAELIVLRERARSMEVTRDDCFS